MKYFIMTIWAALMLFMVGCSQEEIPSSSEENAEVIPVKITLGGDLIQTEESPLSRAETDATDLYGIQVYKDGTAFASGLFDNTSDITINLLAGGTYKFVCTVVKNGKEVCYRESSVLGYGYISRSSSSSVKNAFGASGGDGHAGSILLNKFNGFDYSGVSMTYLNSSYLQTEYRSFYKNSEVDRLYGELSDYTPSVNGVVNLELKRVSFGFKLKVYNIKEGTVSLICKNDYKTFATASNLTSDYETESAIYSMADIYSAWQNADYDYTEPLTLTVTWERAGGLISDTWTKTIQVKRNVMNTIRIKMGTDEKEDTGVGVTPEGGNEGEEEEEIPLG